ncbi:UDP-3-O-acyl-N-acetylglucosamine deacetylase [Azospirillaceae bacterium]
MINHSRHPEIVLQRTLKSSIHCTGVGLHSGSRVALTIAPAEINTGVRFIRTDLRGAGAVIPALWNNVIDTRLCTVIGNRSGISIGTIEHLLAALRGCNIDNAVIRIDGAEVPIMDGSAAPFVFLVECAGVIEQNAARRAIRVLKPVRVGSSKRGAMLAPQKGSSFSFEIDFDSAAVSCKEGFFSLEPEAFKCDISRARTFGFLHEVDQLRQAGLARGGSLANAVVISGDKVLNEGGLRYHDEFVRHKILDSIGDLYLAGAPIIGHFQGWRSGHALNSQLLHTLFADRENWDWTLMTSEDQVASTGTSISAKMGGELRLAVNA